MKSGAYWNKVRYRIEQHLNRIKISQARETFAEAILPPPGSPPFAYRPAFMIAGQRAVSEAEEVEARELFQRRKALRDREPHKIGSLWFCRQPCSSEEYAQGIYQLELASAGALVRDGRGIWVQRGPEWTLPVGSYRIERLSPELMLNREDRQLLAAILAKSPGRNRGRPPIGERPMTDAERKRRSRSKTERTVPGIIVPPPQGPVVPGNYQPFMEIENMISLLERDLAGEYHARLGQLLDRLADAPPDHILTKEEFSIVAAAAVLSRRLRSPAEFN